METNQSKPKYKNKDVKNVYNSCQITTQVSVPFAAVGEMVHQTLENLVQNTVSGKCIIDGYVKPDSVKLITHSSGRLKGDTIIFDVVYNCQVCFPVSGMNVNCVAKDITKAGIRAESADETPSPFVLFISRDQFYSNAAFTNISRDDLFTARVIAQRFELNDKYISIIAEVVPKDHHHGPKKPPRLVL